MLVPFQAFAVRQAFQPDTQAAISPERLARHRYWPDSSQRMKRFARYHS